MFQELVPLVKASDKVVITLSMKGDDMTVVVAPTVSKPDDAALVAPIALTATPAELDAEFANAIGGVTQARQGLAEQVESTKVSMVSVSRRAGPLHCGQVVLTNSLLVSRGEPSVAPNSTSSGNSTGSWSSGTGTMPHGPQ